MSRKHTRHHNPRRRFAFGEVSGIPVITDRHLDLDWTREFEKMKCEIAKTPGASGNKFAGTLDTMAILNRLNRQ